MRIEPRRIKWGLARWKVGLLALLLSVLGLLIWWKAPVQAEKLSQPVPNEACQACHQAPGLQMTLPSGERMSISIDIGAFSRSVHGRALTCLSCHPDITSVPHPPVQTRTVREYQLRRYEVCKGCHFQEYTRTLDSTHNQALAAGNQAAPVCTDCHGAHAIARPSEPRGAISRTCAKCHTAEYNQFAQSVHGRALENNNPDVPVCTSCHGVHSIPEARTGRFRLASVDLCAGCHTNPAMMDKYGLSTNVLDTYLQDFHGVSTSFARRINPEEGSLKAVCTDCHGVHDIRKTDDPESKVIKENLVTTCRQCHPDATANFPTAWLMHYEPSPTKFPIVFIAQAFYWVFVPLIVAGVSLHVLLDLYRAISNRCRAGG